MKNVPIAYQVYSARDEAQENLQAVLCQLKELGYDGVEFAGFYGHSAQKVKAMLEECDLKAVSSHVALVDIEADMEGVIAYHKEIGCKYIAIPFLSTDRRPGTAGFASVIRTMYKFGKLCQANGIQMLYHNHDFEFVSFSDMYGLDFIYEAVPPCLLKTEIDVCWVKYAGVNPAEYLRKYAGRAPVVHLKDFVGRKEGDATPYGLLGESETNGDVPFEFRPVGHGCQNVSEVVEAGIEAGAEWFVVEQDRSVGRTPLEAAAMSIETLKKIGLKI